VDSALINIAHNDMYQSSPLRRQAELIKMNNINHVTGRQLAAARALVGLEQVELAKQANVSAPTLRRMEAAKQAVVPPTNNVTAVIRALEQAGVIFIEQNGNGPGVRLRDRQG
jgi:DNA-binding XRE family transcriptional regulator